MQECICHKAWKVQTGLSLLGTYSGELQGSQVALRHILTNFVTVYERPQLLQPKGKSYDQNGVTCYLVPVYFVGFAGRLCHLKAGKSARLFTFTGELVDIG